MASATPGERRALWPDLLVMGAGAVALAIGISNSTTWLWSGGLALGILGFFAWRGHRFSSWGYLALGLALMLLSAWRINARGLSWSRGTLLAGSLGCIGLAIVDVARGGRPRNRKPDTPVSLVLLQRVPRPLDDQLLATTAGQAWDLDFPAPSHRITPVVTSEGRSFRVQGGSASYAVQTLDHPFWKQPEEVALHLNDVRAQRAMREHLGWISVDLVGPAVGEGRTQAYTQIARLLVELADQDTLAILRPDTGAFRVWDGSVQETLRGATPLECFSISNVAPVVQVCSDDPMMVTAIAEARERWPEFARVFVKRHPEQHFSVKAPITRSGQTEHIWVDVTAITSEYVRGKLGNDPIDLPGLELGTPVSVPISTIEDWIYVLTDQPVGGFTIPAVTSAPSRTRRV